jgi:hypothetical protein
MGVPVRISFLSTSSSDRHLNNFDSLSSTEQITANKEESDIKPVFYAMCFIHDTILPFKGKLNKKWNEIKVPLNLRQWPNIAHNTLIGCHKHLKSLSFLQRFLSGQADLKLEVRR